MSLLHKTCIVINVIFQTTVHSINQHCYFVAVFVMWFNVSLPSRQKQRPKDNIESGTLVPDLTRNEVNNKGVCIDLTLKLGD